MIDITTIGGVIAATWALVAILGKLKGKLQPAGDLVAQNQELFSILIAVILVMVVRFAGMGFQESTGLQLIIQAILAALTAGVAHDKLAKPLVDKGGNVIKILLICLLLSGCITTTPQQRWVMATESYITVLDAASEAHQRGQLSADSWLVIEEWRQVAATSLDMMERAWKAEDDAAFGQAYLEYRRAQATLDERRNEYGQ